MENQNINSLMQVLDSKIPEDKKMYLRNQLQKANDECYAAISSLSLKNTTTTVLLSIFLGWLGVDRFYIEDIGLGVAKLLLNSLTMGIWGLIDIFVSYKSGKNKNLTKVLNSIY